MNSLKLSNANKNHLINAQKASFDTQTQTNKNKEIQNKKDDKKLQKTLIALGSIATAGILLYANRNKIGKLFEKAQGNTPEPKIIEDIAGNLNIEKFDISKNPKNGKEALLSAIEYLENNRIKATFTQGDKSKTIELPQFLYHFTSDECFKKISTSDVIKKSTNEQLQGIFLLDSENFFKHYGSLKTGDKTTNLINGMIKQANVGNKNVPEALREITIIQIPTRDLLINGKLRVRTQEDFFSYKAQVQELSKKVGKNFNLRRLCEEQNRLELKKLVEEKNIMTKAQSDEFFKNMEEALHQGYTLFRANSEKLEETKAIEYIFNNEIQLSKYPNIKVRNINVQDYITFKNGKTNVNSEKLKNFIDCNF